MRTHYTVTLFLMWFSVGIFAQPTSPTVSVSTTVQELSEDQTNIEAFIRIRGNLNPMQSTIYRASGTITAYIPGEKAKPLFRFEMYSVSRYIKTDTSYIMLSREVGLYTDIKTGEVMDVWYNPYTKDTNEVMHVFNDPVNQNLVFQGVRKPHFNFEQTGNGRMTLNSDFFLLYPSPLPKSQFPQHSRSEMYQTAELYSFFFEGKDIVNPEVSSIYSDVSWTRISDFLPWMNMGSKEGYLVYSCRGYKTETVDELPATVLSYVRRFNHVFLHPPDEFKTPNQTTWSNYRKKITTAQ